VTEVDRALRALERASALLDEARRERDTLLETEQKARAAAEAANRAKDEFIAMLGHELRNPLAAIASAASVLGSPQRTEAHVEFVTDVIQRQAGQLKRLIDDLLDVGRVMTGKIRLRREPLDLEALVRQVVGTAQAAGVLARHKVELDAGPAWVQGDRTRLEQILTNLLANAAAYTPASGRIGITLVRDAEEAVLCVTDQGIGIPEQDLARIFDLFYQGGGAGHRVSGGLGIGLTLVKRLAELHGGRVDAQSAGPGRGATFTVRLPATAATHKPAAQEQRNAAGRTVLLVEDNADERESLRLALELRGHRVLKAGDAGEALRHLRLQAPAVAVIDIGLPGMDGYGLARRIRTEYNGRIALVALTGYGAEQDVRRAQEAGFEIHLTKPVDPADLAALVSGAR
jgi:CheY-like chemotaxis protein/nitrogen-specific signal transduction histidine kinase